MAEIEQGILGGVSGKVGTVVGANWRGKNIIRAKPRKSKKKATLSQLNQRAKFKVVANFLGPLNSIVGLYFGQYQGVKSRSNLAMSYHLLEAVEKKGAEYVINYEKVMLTKGIVPNVVMTSAAVADSELKLQWTSNSGLIIEKPTDQLTVVIYSEKNKMFYTLESIVTRDKNEFSTKLPAAFNGKDNSIWVILTNEQKTDCSVSMFVGTF